MLASLRALVQGIYKDPSSPDTSSPSSTSEVNFKLERSDGAVVTYEAIDGVPSAFLLHGVMTPEECELFISNTEVLGYKKFMLSEEYGYKMPDMRMGRDNLSMIAQANEHVIIPLWERMKALVPPVLEHQGKTWKVIEENGLNDRFRFLRYEAGQNFGAHFDGGYTRSQSEISHFTVIIYLNDNFDGGETVFFPGNSTGLKGQKESFRAEKSVHPKQGTALFFRHSGPDSPFHEGAPHRSPDKKKYALRTDVMYRLADG